MWYEENRNTNNTADVSLTDGIQGALTAAYDNDRYFHAVHGLVVHSEHYFFKALALAGALIEVTIPENKQR